MRDGARLYVVDWKRRMIPRAKTEHSIQRTMRKNQLYEYEDPWRMSEESELYLGLSRVCVTELVINLLI